MPSRMQGRMLALATLMLFLTFAPFAEISMHPGIARAAEEASAPDLSGVWMERQDTISLAATEPPLRPWAEAVFRAAKPGYGPRATPDSQDPILQCFPPGVPRIMLLPFPLRIVQTRDEVIMIFEYDHFVREIYTDRRDHPKNLDLTWMGDSIGRWDGDTFVIDTTGLNDKTWLDQVGHPHSDALHVIERLRRIDHNTLQDDITIDDPKAYTKPWSGRQVFTLKPGWNIREYVCEDNINFLEYHRREVGGATK
ncbi:MAG TPA: hypothetical protein VNE63_18865 [Candidatus Acidoferrales bacterium]|nr:hypothetical protein [Candidatus Acidoferrales bacterium]